MFCRKNGNFSRKLTCINKELHELEQRKRVSDRQQKERRKVLRDAITKAECQDQQQLKPSRDMRNNTKGSYKHAISKSWFRQIFLFG